MAKTRAVAFTQDRENFGHIGSSTILRQFVKLCLQLTQSTVMPYLEANIASQRYVK